MPDVFVPGIGFFDAGSVGFGPALQAAIATIASQSQARDLTTVAGLSFAEDIARDRNPDVAKANRLLIEAGIITQPIALEPITILSNASVQTPELAAFLPSNVLIGKLVELQSRRAQFLAAAGPPGRFPPGRSLQAGEFLPCSADDPAGRCITPGARQLQNRHVARVAQGR